MPENIFGEQGFLIASEANKINVFSEYSESIDFKGFLVFAVR
jgi:hypothetical protein